MSVNFNEADERVYLERVRAAIERSLVLLGDAVDTRYAEVMEMKKYLQESKTDMDHIEKAGVRQSIDQMTRIGDHTVTRARRLAKLYKTPYFGRIDFQAQAESVQPFYIGIHSFRNEDERAHLVHDWRAPVCSLFYDFELGEAFFDAPAGRITGALVLKRQYRIENGALVYMLETSLNIHDEVLQQELSRASDDKMKNIVATIQRDQNAIIRNERTHALIIQGAAGSGKTSIALHRIAYLLYKFKDSITSNEILIISPNKVFAHYISHVLPELGEEMIKETTMEVLATYLLDYRETFQTFCEQVALLLESGDSGYEERIRFKATSYFPGLLETYARHVGFTNLQPSELEIGLHAIPADQIFELFRQCGAMPYALQINHVTEAIVERMKLEYGIEIAGTARARVRGQLKKMFVNTNLKSLYKAFYAWLGKPELFKADKGAKYEYSDVFPLIYLKILLEGVKPHDKVKHLVVDEMQDYTPVQYQVIARLFSCKKTILGDRNQSVNPHGASSAEAIQEILSRAECMYMNKSYRSTLQITGLAQRINRNEHLEPIERHGEEPDIVACANGEEELHHVRQRVVAFLKSGYKSMGLVCKTQAQANALHAGIRDLGGHIRLLTARSTVFSGGVIVATAHLAKGLEFDQVVVPFCSDKNYNRLIDRHMLYVACTRAMHKLTLTHTGRRSPFLE